MKSSGKCITDEDLKTMVLEKQNVSTLRKVCQHYKLRGSKHKLILITRIKEHQQLLQYAEKHGVIAIEEDQDDYAPGVFLEGDPPLKSMLDSWSSKKTDELISKREICIYIYFSILNMDVQFEDKNYDTIKVIYPLTSFIYDFT